MVNQNGDSSGLLNQIFKRPGLLVGGKLVVTGKIPCIDCEEFDSFDMCPGVGDPKECPVKRREIDVRTVECSYYNNCCICNINHGELRLDTENKYKIQIEKMEIPWENLKQSGKAPGA